MFENYGLPEKTDRVFSDYGNHRIDRLVFRWILSNIGTCPIQKQPQYVV
jgi:hypothetical protein